MPHKPPSHRPARVKATGGRPSAAARGYDANWRRFRLMMLARNPVCPCGAAARHVDHVVSLEKGGDKYDETNLQCLCHSCHSRKTCAQDQGFGRSPA